MAFKNKLLATAAIPLIALMGMGSVSAAELLRPSAPAEVQSFVVKVQAADDDEETLKQKRREKRKQQNENADQTQQTDQEQVKPRHKKQQAADDQQMQQDDSGQMQQTDQEPVKPRKKKQQAADDQQMQMQDDSGQMQQTDQEPVKPRKKKHQAADDQQMQQDDSGQMQTQQSDEEPVKPRRKKQQDNAASDQNQSDDEQLKNAIDNNKKHRKQKSADEQQMQGQDDSGQMQTQQSDEEQVNPRRKKHEDNATSDQNQSTDDKLKNAIENNKRKKHKNNQDQDNQDQAEQPADDNGEADQANRKNKAEQPVDVKKAKDIAEDPSKTTDTVVLPVENGAAVLDSDKDADKGGADRDRRKREREEVKAKPAPKSDKDAQRGFKDDEEIRIKPVLELKGEHIPGFKGYDDFGGRRVDDRDNRVIINIGGKIVIRNDDDRRLARDTDIRYERLQNNLIREVIVQPNGDKIVTVRNRYGEIVRRSRIERDNTEIVIFFSPDLERGRDRLFLRDPGDDLPPMRLSIPVDDYIVDVSGSGGHRNFEDFLEEPPVERVERVYSVDEVKNSARIRDKMRRIDLDTITFETGSSDIAEDQVQSLKQVGRAIKSILDKDPGETFLIEGHTDAVGSDESNLVLSDQRAESIANVLSEAFDIPAENLVTQGYGERYLKIDSDGPERENRRVTIRRITPLVRPLEAAEK